MTYTNHIQLLTIPDITIQYTESSHTFHSVRVRPCEVMSCFFLQTLIFDLRLWIFFKQCKSFPGEQEIWHFRSEIHDFARYYYYYYYYYYYICYQLCAGYLQLCTSNEPCF